MPRRRRGARRCSPASAARERADAHHRHPHPRRRRRRPVRRAARQERQPRTRRHHRGQGPARQMRLHPHGARRLQRRAVAGRLGRAPFHGHDRRRRLAQRPGSRLAPGRDRAQAHPRAGNRARLLLRPQSGRHRAPEGLRRADFRPHRAQRRPHRHRDHQPAGGTGLAARRAPPRGPPRARSHPDRRRQRARRRADARHAHAASRSWCARGRRCWRPAAGRPCTAITRRPATSPATASPWRCAPACRCATSRWCNSIRPDCLPAKARA